MKSVITVENAERVLLVGVALKRRPRGGAPATNLTGQESLAELGELARSAGANVVGSRLQLRDALDSATMVGRGVLEELKHEAERLDAGLIILDRNLSPVQHRNIERGTDCRVIDRT